MLDGKTLTRAPRARGLARSLVVCVLTVGAIACGEAPSAPLAPRAVPTHVETATVPTVPINPWWRCQSKEACSRDRN